MPYPEVALLLLNEPGHSRTLGQLVQLHMDAGSGLPEGEYWTQEALAEKCDTSPLGIRHALGDQPDKGFDFEFLLTLFGLNPPPEGDADAQHRAEELRGAWANVDPAKQFGNVNRTPKLHTAPIGAVKWPRDLPSELTRRRELVHDAIAAVFDSGMTGRRPGPLERLRADWHTPLLADANRHGANTTEAENLFIGFGQTVAACNGLTPPWNDHDESLDLMQRRKRESHYIAKLLFALIWSEEAWLQLPALRSRSTLLPTKYPRLMHAGMDMVRGAEFELPARAFKRPLAADARPTLGTWPDADKWHLPLYGEIQHGLGLDRRWAMARHLWTWFNAGDPPEQRRTGESDEDFARRLRRVEVEDLAPIISVQSRYFGKRSLAFSAQFESDDDPGLEHLRRYVQELNQVTIDMPAAVVAYRDGGSNLLLGNERAIVHAIELCLADIEAIGQRPAR